MITRVLVAAAVVCVLGVIQTFLRAIRFNGNIARVRADDEGMNAAKAEALAMLPRFLARLSAPGIDRSTVAVKAPLTIPAGTEHVWVTNVRVEGDEFVGTIDNDLRAAPGKRAGDAIRVRQWEISDWKLVENGQLVGGFTIRYFVSKMPAKQRAALIANLPFTIGTQAIPRAA